MDYLPGFKWPVPIAFATAISQCRFEEGDTLYSAPFAYESTWGDAMLAGVSFLQVRLPKRQTSLSIPDSTDVFSANWSSSAVVDVYKFTSPQSPAQHPPEPVIPQLLRASLTTTQGRIFTFLWKGGDPDALVDLDNYPKPPIRVAEVTRQLVQAKTAAMNLQVGDFIFVMARDLAHSTSNAKYHAVTSKLRPYMSDVPISMTPKDAGLVEHARISPGIEIAFFPTTGTTRDALESLLRGALSTSTGSNGEGRFRRAAHGLLFSRKDVGTSDEPEPVT